jgi:hypothetical protein
MSTLSRSNLFQIKSLNFHYGYVKFRALLKNIGGTLARVAARQANDFHKRQEEVQWQRRNSL